MPVLSSPIRVIDRALFGRRRSPSCVRFVWRREGSLGDTEGDQAEAGLPPPVAAAAEWAAETGFMTAVAGEDSLCPIELKLATKRRYGIGEKSRRNRGAAALAGWRRVLFVCVHNAGRSQISEALFRELVAGEHEAHSAGTQPAERIHAEVVSAMGEIGIALADHRPERLTRDLAE